MTEKIEVGSVVAAVDLVAQIREKPLQISPVIFRAGNRKSGQGDLFLKQLRVGYIDIFGVSAETERKAA